MDILSGIPEPEVINIFFILNSAKHKIYPAKNVNMLTILNFFSAGQS